MRLTLVHRFILMLFRCCNVNSDKWLWKSNRGCAWVNLLYIQVLLFGLCFLTECQLLMHLDHLVYRLQQHPLEK